ncbi:MAG TPA: hypothetical protein VL357_01605 [Rariglobus sp.]|nr:hypothetical protein [Rariglobus sp.]
MSLPAAIIREVPAEPSTLGGYSRLLVPAVIVTAGRGREVYADTRRLFERLAALALEIRNGGPQIQAIWHGQEHVSESGILALELMLELNGLEVFNRACKAQRGGARAIGTKYQWYFMSEYLGWTWERV